jgi:hypothetical protein
MILIVFTEQGAPLVGDCCSCAFLSFLYASILISRQPAWESDDVGLSIAGVQEARALPSSLEVRL